MSSVKRRKVQKRTSQVSKKTEKSFVKTGELKTLLEMPLDILYEVRAVCTPRFDPHLALGLLSPDDDLYFEHGAND